MRITGNTILITGGGSGIGLALARAFLERDNQVLVCGRDPEKLDAVRHETPGLHTFRCDITQQDENQALMGHIQDRFPEINMLVNNAAISQQVDLAGGTADISRIHQDILTNLVAPIDLTIALMLLMRKQRSAAIVNVSSALAYVPLASHAVYCATKAALHSFTQSLRYQLRDSSIRVFEIIPPVVDTPMAAEYRGPKMSTEAVVQGVMRGLQRNREEIRLGQARMLYLMSRLAPRFIFRVLHKGWEQELKRRARQDG